MKSPFCTVPKPVEIEESLNDIIADEYTNAVFECKVAEDCQVPDDEIEAVWFKDGSILRSCRKTRINSMEKWHRLEIASVTKKDQGVYLVQLGYRGILSLSKGYLYHRPMQTEENQPMYLPAAPRHNYGATMCLVHSKVAVGGVIELQATFKEPKVQEFLWFKGNTPLMEDDRTIILSDGRTTSLSIMNAQRRDSGIYLVMYRTRYGFESSSTDVLVLDLEPEVLLNCEVIPTIDEPFPRFMEAYYGEEVRIMAKVHYDANTVITWARGLEPLTMKQNMEIYYYNNYIALKIYCVSISDGGVYTLHVRNRITGHTESTTCTLLIDKLPTRRLTPTKIIYPLDAAVACIGSSLSFKCAFEIEDPHFCSVLWEVGKFRVERTNLRFNVFNNDTEFHLHIKRLEPDMAGGVVCHIRKAIPGQKPVTLCVSSANLTIVPLMIMEGLPRDELAVPPANTGFHSILNKVSVPIMQKTAAILKDVAGAPDPDEIIPEFSLRIVYCKCDTEIYFLEAEGEGMPEDATLTIKGIPQDNANDRLIQFKWTPYGSNWYAITVEDEYSFTGAGISSTPAFRFRNPPLEKALKVHIKVVDPLPDLKESFVEISEVRIEDMTYPRHVRIQPMELYKQQFMETGDKIGKGAFGQVVLIRNEAGQYFAAKNIKTILQKRRDSARREFELLKSLQHPRLVRLHTAFSTRDNFILVMDYLWGGELFERLCDEDYEITEIDVIIYVRQICEGLQYIHSHSIAHLDMKPENIICLSPNSRQIKIADFGLARVIHERYVLRAVYGTKDYVAPEVLNYEPLSLACDMWSFGVITYLLLSGVLPFGAANWLDFAASITKGTFNYDDPAFKDVSELARDFMNRLIVLTPADRMTAQQALQHPWLQEEPPRGTGGNPMRRARQNLRSYLANYRERWQRAGNVMIAAHRLLHMLSAANRRRDEDDKPGQNT